MNCKPACRARPCSPAAAGYGYLVDFEAAVFEAYCGAQREPHRDGRFALPAADGLGFYPARMVGQWPITLLPADGDFVAAFDGARP